MVKKKPVVIWDTEAAEQLKEIYDYIKPDSLQEAQKVKSEIIATTKIIPSNPEMFALDLLRENNYGSYRWRHRERPAPLVGYPCQVRVRSSW